MLIDDAPDIHKIVKSVLQSEGLLAHCELKSAFDGAAAKQLFTEFQPDIVITDIYMPEVDGYDLTIYFKTSDPAPYVIAITGGDLARKSIAQSLSTVKQLGADAIIKKADLCQRLAPSMLDSNLCHSC